MKLKILGLLLLLTFLMPIKEGCVVVPVPEPSNSPTPTPTVTDLSSISPSPTASPTKHGGSSGGIIIPDTKRSSDININITTEDGATPSSNMEVK